VRFKGAAAATNFAVALYQQPLAEHHQMKLVSAQAQDTTCGSICCDNELQYLNTWSTQEGFQRQQPDNVPPALATAPEIQQR
jgi:hypothetical protein